MRMGEDLEPPIKAQWVKKQVTKREAGYYKALDSYHIQAENDNGAIVAFTRIIDGELPDHLVPCTVDESIKLNEKTKTSKY